MRVKVPPVRGRRDAKPTQISFPPPERLRLFCLSQLFATESQNLDSENF